MIIIIRVIVPEKLLLQFWDPTIPQSLDLGTIHHLLLLVFFSISFSFSYQRIVYHLGEEVSTKQVNPDRERVSFENR